ncbi:hypothetical protein GEMRC1_005088 [Eukaryota sp. GEM-RC1]
MLFKKSDSDDLLRKYLLIKDKPFSEVKRIPCKSVSKFNDDDDTVNVQREAFLAFLGDDDASMIPSLITVETEPQYKTSFDVTVCPILDELPKVEGVVVRFELPLEVMTSTVCTMLHYFNNLHNCFSVEITRLYESFRVSFNCANYQQLFTLESLVKGNVIFLPDLCFPFTNRSRKTTSQIYMPADIYDFKLVAVKPITPGFPLLNWIASIDSFSTILPNLINWNFSENWFAFNLNLRQSLSLSSNVCDFDFYISQPTELIPSLTTNYVLKGLVKDSFVKFIHKNSINSEVVEIPENISTPTKKLQWTSINRLLLPPELLTEFAMCFASCMTDLTKWNLDFSYGRLHGLLSEILKFCETLYNALKTDPLDFEATRSDCIDFIKCIIKEQISIDDGAFAFPTTNFLRQFVKVAFTDFVKENSTKSEVVKIRKKITNPSGEFLWISINQLELPPELITNLAVCFASFVTDLRLDFSHECLFGLLSEMLKFCENLYNALKRKPLDYEATRSDCIGFIKCIVDHQIPIYDGSCASDPTGFLETIF